MIRVPSEPSPNDIGVTIETFLEDLIDEVNEVRAVIVESAGPDEVIALAVTTYTADYQLHGEWISLYESAQTWVSLTNVDGQEFVVPIYVVATTDGPPAPGTMEGLTTVYCDDGWDHESISLDEGLERLRERVGMPRDEVGEYRHSEQEQGG